MKVDIMAVLILDGPFCISHCLGGAANYVMLIW